ncbi:MAG TPA: GNVR domain-containing protein [bacterium]|jgi:uncharacterized protein involved in exopolysaccharide biosynthesis
METAPRRLTDHVALWIRWRWLLVGTAFLAALLTFLIASLIPKTYRASAVVMPPFEGGVALPFMGGVSVDIFGANEVPAASMVTLLKSRALKERVHQRIDLMEHYKQPDLESAFNAFEAHLQVEIESEATFGSVSIIAFKIHVIDRDPAFCAELLHVILAAWDALTIELNRRGATLRRQFVEESLSKTTAELAVTEDSLRAFQERYGIAEFQSQVEGTVTSAVALEQKIAEARIAVEVLSKLYQSGHPLVQRAKLELNGLMQEKKKMQDSKSFDSFLLPLKGAPELSLTYFHLYRDVRVLQAVYEVLIQQYQQSKIQELKDTPALRILDRGEVPLYKYKPRRLLLSMIASLGAFFLAMLAVYFLDYVQRFRGAQEYHWIDEIKDYLLRDWRRMSKLWRRRD